MGVLYKGIDCDTAFCANCQKCWGAHSDDSCPNGLGKFVLKKGTQMAERITFSGLTETRHDYVETQLKVENGTTYVNVSFHLTRTAEGRNQLVINANSSPEEIDVKFDDKNEKLLLELEEKADYGGESVQIPDMDVDLSTVESNDDEKSPDLEDESHDIHNAEDVNVPPDSSFPTTAANVTCPQGHPMILRQNRRNGRQFWGCSQYPKCHETKKYNS